MLFLYNDPTAPGGLLGEVFAESGFDISTFDVVSPDRPDDPLVEGVFPDPLDYDVIVPLGARWAVYDGPWFQWHFDRLSTPPGALEVARNGSATQAFVQGRALGLQFHPEVDTALVDYWIAEDAGADLARLGLRADDIRSRTVDLADDAARRLRLLVAGFLRLLSDETLDDPHRLG